MILSNEFLGVLRDAAGAKQAFGRPPVELGACALS